MTGAPGNAVDTAPRAARLPDLGVRAASGFALIFVALGSTLLGGPVFVLAWLVAAGIVHFEWQRLVGGAALPARVAVGLLGLVGLAFMATGPIVPIVVVLLALTGVEGALAGPDRRVWAAGGMAYAGTFVVAICALRFSHPAGARAVIWLFAAVWASDVFAYLGGRLIGGPKLWLRISPSKTWSGTLTGLVAAALVGTFAALRAQPLPTLAAPILALTLATAIVSQAGDAFESGIKRRFGVKDSGRLIPGHGGLMDRLDGFVAAAIFAWGFGLVRGLPSIALGLFQWG